MKILKVRFKNLNSLEGEWEIDFNHSAYNANGIFAITGPTGAGKTTLLDAICLALYGRTPRLKILSKSTNEVMTRQTGECFAEVIFTTLKGVFRCHWSHHRARKKPQGDLQQPRHEIVDHEKNVVLENMIKNVAAAVEDVTGMSFDQFTRSIMLAQGSFAAFLQASADDRAPLLEQITGTDIYSRISQKVHHHTADQQREYTQMTEEVDGLAVLSDAEKADLENNVETKLAYAKTLRKDIDTAQRSITWLKTIETLKKDILNLEEEYSITLEKSKSLSSKRSSLQKAKTASLHVPQHQHIQRLKISLEEETEEMKRIKHETSSLQNDIKSLNQERDNALKNYNQSEKAYQDNRVLVVEVKTLDAQINDRKKRNEDEEKIFDRIHERTAQIQSNIDKLSAQLAAKNKELDHYKTYLEEHENDSALIENLAVFHEKNKQLQINILNYEQLLEQHAETLKLKENTAETLAKARKGYSESRQELNTAAEKYSQIIEEISSIRSSHPHLHKQHDKLSARLSILQKLSTLVGEREKTVTENKNIQQKIDNIIAERKSVQKEEKKLIEKCSTQEQIVAHQQEILVLNRRIKNYEEERKKLHQGVPCPLCGSTTHPFHDKNPATSCKDTENIEREKHLLLTLQKRITELQTQTSFHLKQLDEHQQRKADLEKQIAAYDQQIISICQTQDIDKSEQLSEILIKEIEKTESDRSILSKVQISLEQLEKNAAELREEIDALKEKQNSQKQNLDADTIKLENQHEKAAVLEERSKEMHESILNETEQLSKKLSPFGFSSFEPTKLTEILNTLELRQNKWIEAREKVQSLEKELREIENTQQKEQALLVSAVNEKTRARKSIDALMDDIASLAGKRNSIYGTKDPDSEDQQYNKALRTSKQHLDNVSENLRTKENRIISLTDHLDRLVTSTTKTATQIANEQRIFEDALSKDGFIEIEDFLSAVLNEEQILELELLFKDLDERTAQLKTLLEEKRKTLSIEFSKDLSSESISDLQGYISEKNDLLNRILQEIGRLQGKLEENEKLLQEQQNKRNMLIEQEKELLRWKKLDELIGSASGKKFRNFAQGITFEIMVDLANTNLRKMSDRYILIRDSTHPLNINIIDNYRAGDIRSTQNLSGGESFLVSLALALGLSNMAGKNVRVDSFFLDEGFGTLDEETLDIALQTLAGLQQDGKMIGIISHVSLLKERLDTQIQLVPEPGGHSIIEGPGVRVL